MNRITVNKNTFLVLSLALITVIPFLVAVVYAPVGIDSSYFLSIVERISDGYVPYRDLSLSYTPVFFYCMYIVKYIFNVGVNYEFFLSVHFLIEIINAYLIFRISVLIMKSKKYSFCSAILFIMASYWNGGNEVFLEMPSLFWGLLSLFFVLRETNKISDYIIAGTLSALAFLTKQYGFGFFFLVLFIVCTNHGKLVVRNFLVLSIAYVLTIVIFLILFKEGLFKALFGNGYGYSSIDILIDRSVRFFVRIFPNILVGMVLIFFSWGRLTRQSLRYVFFLTIWSFRIFIAVLFCTISTLLSTNNSFCFYIDLLYFIP
ncbi:hypothetical protein [Spirosoma rigui]|uniref:hypothetical protein n=1 Tax=Spirosoma rigui TaxID=564064 RepID=UPI0012D3201C|nr:hypothetical protein [Spirosoma rigui]